MNRKKVVILLPWMKMGGTNKIAINFMRDLAEYCDVTLVLSENTGELLDQLPQNIQIINDTIKSFREILKGDLKRLRVKYLIKDFSYYMKIKTGKDSIDNYKYIVDRSAAISNEVYDCAISYHGQSPERLLNLIYRTNARKKVVWIHGEMSFSQNKIDQLKKYYEKVDHFFFVSNSTRESFAERIPFEQDKSTVYYNPIDKLEIIEKAKENIQPVFSDQYTNILTVGRLSKEKGQDMVPAITKKLIDNGYPIHWYLIGDGETRIQIQNLIKQYGVEDHVFLLGTKANPYCYMKACTLYVQPSYTEGYSTTICEAGILGKAIIGTIPSGGIKEQIEEGKDGLIVDATVEGISNGISCLIEQPELRRTFEKNILKKNFEGKGEISKFLKIIE